MDHSKSKVISTAINNPITFILGQLHNPSELLRVFTYPIPVSFPRRRSVVAGAEMLAIIALIVAGFVVGLTIMCPLIIALSPIWVPATMALSVLAVGFFSVFVFGAVVSAAMTWLPGRFFPTHKPRASAPETTMEKTKSM
ncbi:hypothetical protein QN277_011655 [Acacia crassicarpa]|uniref:Uncharacterized protein n=1 Tax=Acacia crassicarpa TaxID=499986 RepID=A0AAE1TCZ3_9FABA|nr:hypothetical protein QN277_011655 [Acacia crassicarpa]